MIDFFTDPVHRARNKGRRETAAQVVAQLRAACSECPDGEGFRAIVAEDAERSPEFAELCARRDMVVLHNPWPGTGTEEKPRWPASPEGRRDSMRQIRA